MLLRPASAGFPGSVVVVAASVGTAVVVVEVEVVGEYPGVLVALVVVVVMVAGKDSYSAATALSIAAMIVPADGSSASAAIELISRRRRRWR